jgi:hypothetical protein
VLEGWKSLSGADRSHLLTDNIPWEFLKWIDTFPHSDRRPIRNAILYFLFPDQLERNLSSEHRRMIVYAFRAQLPENLRPKSKNPTLYECDRAISEIRKQLEAELKTSNIDFYLPSVYARWWTGIRKKAKDQIASELKRVLNEYNFELNQCGDKKDTLADRAEVDASTGFWARPQEATSKPLRWIVHDNAATA